MVAARSFLVYYIVLLLIIMEGQVLMGDLCFYDRCSLNYYHTHIPQFTI